MTTSFTILFHKSKNCLCHLSSSDDGFHFAGCLVEHDWSYLGGTIVAGDQNSNGLPPPPSPITSWEDCQTYCRTEQVKYFTWWAGTKCSCRDVKQTRSPCTPPCVFGQTIDCDGEYSSFHFQPRYNFSQMAEFLFGKSNLIDKLG